jgi:predicted small lipoprotein YifL
MRRLVLASLLSVAIAACGGKDPAPAAPSAPAEPGDDRTEIERRRDAACEELGPRLTACAVEDAKRTLSAAELKELDLDNTAPVHTREAIDDCKSRDLSSRQVRVYEVCLREETACEPLAACLDHAKPEAAEGAASE